MSISNKSIRIDTHHTVSTFLILAIILQVLIVALDLIANLTETLAQIPTPVADLFNMALEANLLTWYSSILLFIAGLCCAVLFGLSKHAKHRPTTLAWGFSALMFTFMSLDDVASIHERTGLIVKMIYTGEIAANGILAQTIIRFPSYYWQAIFLPLYAGFAVLLLFLAKRMMVYKYALPAIFTGLCCYVAAVGLDFIDGYGAGFKAFTMGSAFMRENILHLSQVIEEFLELLGTTLIISGLLGECLQIIDGYSVRCTPTKKVTAVPTCGDNQ